MKNDCVNISRSVLITSYVGMGKVFDALNIFSFKKSIENALFQRKVSYSAFLY